MNKNRPKQVIFRLSEKEYLELGLLIKESGLSKQEYIRRAVLNYGSLIIIDDTENEEETKNMYWTLMKHLKQIGGELGRQGNNLNQIARALNQQRYVDNDQILQTLGAVQKTAEEMKELWQLLKQHLQKRQ